MAPADVHPTMNDPFATFGATQQQQQQQQPQQPGNVDPWASMSNSQHPANGINQQNDPFASTMNGPSSNEMPPQNQPPAPVENTCDPWAMNGQNQSVTVPPMQIPNEMPPAPMPSNDPFAMNNQVQSNTMMPAQEQSVPTTVVCNENSNSPPSPIGDQSVTGGAIAGGPEVPTFNGYQQPPHNPTMMPIQEQPVLPQNGNPFNMSQPTTSQNAPVSMPTSETHGQLNAPTNPFGTMDLTGPMNNLSVQGGTNGPESNVTAATEMVVATDNQAPTVFQEAGTGVPPMAPPPASQPPLPPSEPPMMQPPQFNGMMAPQAPLSPTDDPFAVYPSVVSPGAVLSPQVNDPFGYAFSPMTSPTEGQMGNVASMPTNVPDMPFTECSAGAEDPFAMQQQAMVPSNTANDDPFGVFGSSSNSQQQAVVPTNTANDDPFGVFGNAAPPAPADPFGSSYISNSNAAVSSNQVDDDPFGVFAAPAPVEQPSQQPSAAPTQDPWAAAGFNEVSQASLLSASTDDEDEAPIELDTNGLPKQGDYYEARINARSLGAMFYTARDLENTLLYNMPTNVIDSLKSRPIVAYVAENSAAYNAGVHLGHCILSVNGTEVSDPDECADVIRNASRPMNIRGYVMPELEVSLSEGKHMVKYDKKEMRAPSSTLEWKEKYVVVGGIVSKPFVLNMYRSKAEYDTAVKETHMNYKCSVKVKQFDLRGARLILKGKDGKPDKVNYHTSVWHYITILPEKGYPIKISSESLDELEPVYAAVRRFIRKDMQNRSQQYGWK
eukprot:scaffold1758_cov40-Cyclotella_meneghiniana.AAC.3